MPELFYAATGGSQLSRQRWAMITQDEAILGSLVPFMVPSTSSRPPLPFDSPALCPIKCYLWVLKVKGFPGEPQLGKYLQ